MNFRAVLHVLGLLLLVLAGVLIVPLLVALLTGDPRSAVEPFVWTIVASGVVGGLMAVLMRRGARQLRPSDGFGIVTLGWITISAFGALPFYYAELGLSYTDCYFETMSGFTTTGASILTDIEGLPLGIGFWRCMTQWLGGMGIVVLTVAILPMLGTGGYQLFRAEVPGPTKDRLTPRIRQTAMTLWKVYVLLSLVEILLLMLCGMSLYESTCHAFTTLSTGGFSPQAESIGAYGAAVQWIITFFMLMAGVNFVVHYKFMFGHELRAYWRSEEVRWYVVLVLAFAVVLYVQIYGDTFDVAGQGADESFESVELTARTALFNSTTIITTTGYANADFNAWPAMARMLLLFGMFLGGCAGSTAGGLKTVRVMSIAKYAWREIRQLFMPRAVLPVRVEGAPVQTPVLASIAGFFFLWMLLVAVSSLLLAAILHAAGPAAETGDARFLTALSAVISAIGNIGPGLSSVGPYGNFAGIPDVGKWLLTFLMLVGRLEIYSVLILLVPSHWRR